VKRYETRTWAARPIEGLAIHASKTKLTNSEWFTSARNLRPVLMQAGITAHRDSWQVGGIVAVANLVRCVQTEQFVHDISDVERAAGNWRGGRWAWELADVVAIPLVPCIGAQGLFELTPMIVAKVIAALDSARAAARSERMP
jgi:hypothetical protein